jgi:hypothetical protein
MLENKAPARMPGLNAQSRKDELVLRDYRGDWILARGEEIIQAEPAPGCENGANRGRIPIGTRSSLGYLKNSHGTCFSLIATDWRSFVIVTLR